jgi:hypothetical protein
MIDKQKVANQDSQQKASSENIWGRQSDHEEQSDHHYQGGDECSSAAYSVHRTSLYVMDINYVASLPPTCIAALVFCRSLGLLYILPLYLSLVASLGEQQYPA